jgi:adenosylhomocysteine nucleosidase
VTVHPIAPVPVVAATGLAVEARIAAGTGVRAVAGALDARGLAAALEREVARGAGAIISFGIAGGLVPHVAPGTWLVGKAVVTAQACWPCHRAWTNLLAMRLAGARLAVLAGSDRVLGEPAAKRALHEATGAVAIDTESHVAAAIAAAHGIPFAIFRVVADPVNRPLPPAASVALGSEGRVHFGRVARSLAGSPSQLPLLARSGIDARIALRELLRGRRLLGAHLGYRDLRDLDLDLP